MDSRWSKIEVGKGKPPIELAKEDDVTFVQGIEYKLYVVNEYVLIHFSMGNLFLIHLVSIL